MSDVKKQRELRRKRRVRAQIHGSKVRPRLSVSRSNRGVSAQLIDDDAGHTVAAVSWTENELRKLQATERAKRAGEMLAERALDVSVKACVFDRRSYKYHGQIQAFAEGARSGGLAF
jgi:large subunit ribosomal protein L18